MRRLFMFGFILLILPLAQNAWAANDTQFLRIASTVFGPSGLLFTQSIDTLAPGDIEMGLGLSVEESDQPDFSEQQGFATAAMGLTPSIEVSAQIPYFGKVNRRDPKTDESGVGDINLSLKWRFMDADVDLNFIGWALSVTVFFPTGDLETATGSVDSWGLKALVVSSAETEVAESVLVGFYADGGVYIQDSGSSTEEQHGIIDLGILVPLTETKDVQFLLEVSRRIQRDIVSGPNSSGQANYTAITPGFRYITKRIALTAGWQLRINEKPDDGMPVEDSTLLIFQGSYQF